MVSIIVVEDDTTFGETLVEHLRDEGHDVQAVGNASALRDYLGRNVADLALLDLGLPDDDGLAVAVELRRKYPAMGIIMVTARDTMADRISGLRLGGDAYITKPIHFGELSAVMDSVLRRLSSAGGRQKEADAVWRLSRTEWKLFAPGVNEGIRLTAKEYQFVERLGTAQGQPVTRRDLIQAIGANPAIYEPRSLDALVRRLRRKIEDEAGQSPPIHAAHAVGYAFTGTLVVG